MWRWLDEGFCYDTITYMAEDAAEELTSRLLEFRLGQMDDVVEDRHANEPDEESSNSPANDDPEVEEAKVEETVKDTPSVMENRTT
jgi:hypothetical protein